MFFSAFLSFILFSEIKSLGAAEMRNVFLEFFKQDKNHTCWHSSSSIPHANPTLLFANAGMHQVSFILLYLYLIQLIDFVCLV
jgi:hypothetical protein